MPSSRESFRHVISVPLQPWSPDARADTERSLHQAMTSCSCCQNLDQATESTEEWTRVRTVFPCKIFFKLCLVAKWDLSYVSDQVSKISKCKWVVVVPPEGWAPTLVGQVCCCLVYKKLCFFSFVFPLLTLITRETSYPCPVHPVLGFFLTSLQFPYGWRDAKTEFSLSEIFFIFFFSSALCFFPVPYPLVRVR